MASPMLLASFFAPILVSALIGGVPQVGSPAASLPPTPAHGAPAAGCQAVRRSSDVNVYCVQSGGITPSCCEAVLQAVRRGGLSCLCRIAAAPYMASTGYTGGDLIHWYRQCGGRIPMDAYTALHCGFEAPPSPTKKKLPPGPSATTPSPMSTRSVMYDSESVKAPPASKRTEQQTYSKENIAVDEAQPSERTIVIKVEARHVAIGVITVIVVLVIISLALYIKFAAPGPKRDRAKKMLDLFLSFTPLLVKEAVKEVQKEQEANGTSGGTASGTGEVTEEMHEDQDLYEPRGRT